MSQLNFRAGEKEKHTHMTLCSFHSVCRSQLMTIATSFVQAFGSTNVFVVCLVCLFICFLVCLAEGMPCFAPVGSSDFTDGRCNAKLIFPRLLASD